MLIRFMMFDMKYLVFVYIAISSWPSLLGLQNTPTATLKKGKTPPMNILIRYKTIPS